MISSVAYAAEEIIMRPLIDDVPQDHIAHTSLSCPKTRRGIATRYAKIPDAFIAAVHVRCIAIWAAIRAWIVETISSEIVTAL